jgi:hypothetical protein
MDQDTKELIPTRQSLLGRLKDWADSESWRDFFDTYWKLIYGVARRVKVHASAEQYQMFDYYVRKRWTARKVARTLGVTVGRVYVAKHRISRAIKKEMELLEKKADYAVS